jgi:hypothetical protein
MPQGPSYLQHGQVYPASHCPVSLSPLLPWRALTCPGPVLTLGLAELCSSSECAMESRVLGSSGFLGESIVVESDWSLAAFSWVSPACILAPFS